jgi:(R,R)-butanediol dehydrogenase/meso-butanediol dehydrogenase/diacetyl reductase
MKAVRWHGREDVRVDEVPEPVVVAGDDVIVEIGATAICASDVAEWRSGPHVIPTRRPHPLTGMKAPITLGHEYVGQVVVTGADVRGLAVGARVCGDSCIRCHRCYWCLRGEYNICETGGSVGLHQDGSFARFLKVPAYCLQSVPATVDDLSATLVEPFAVGLHALRQTRMQAGDLLLVMGYGMIGAGAALLGKALGATVVVAERSAHRSDLAVRSGADHVLDAEVLGGDVKDLRNAVRVLSDGRGADVVLECTGRADVLPQAIECARRGGRIGLCGISHEPAGVRTDRLVYFEREIIGCLGYQYNHPAVVNLLASNKLPDLSLLFGKPISLDQVIADGFTPMAYDEDSPLRIPIRIEP